MNRIGHNNCPIIEVTGDNVRVGRCWFYCPDDVCPRHGNVKQPLEYYRETGKLTCERIIKIKK